MAITIKQGDIITATGVRSGTSSNGEYFLCRVKGDKTPDVITIWNNDGFTCCENARLRIVDILSVKHGSRKFNEKWYTDTDVTCTLELDEAPGDPFEEFAEDFGQLEDDSTLPW